MVMVVVRKRKIVKVRSGRAPIPTSTKRKREERMVERPWDVYFHRLPEQDAGDGEGDAAWQGKED